MCGRYAASVHRDELIEAFELEQDATGEPSRSILAAPQTPPPGTPDYNMAPTKQAPVVLTRRPRTSEEHAPPVRQLRLVTWGLVPSWAKDTRTGQRMANARAESVLDKPSFARAAAARRCLVPAQGWYEWQASPTVKDARGRARRQPFFTHRADRQVVAMAGLYEFWRDPAVEDGHDPGAWLTTFTIITTEAEPGLDRIHDRQPLVLEQHDWQAWLDPANTDLDEVRALLEFSEPGRFEAYPVSTAVNATRNNGEQLLMAVPERELRGVVDPMTGEVLGQ